MIEKISYEQVNQTADSLNNSASKMKEILAEVEQRMQKVDTEDTWKSAAAEELYAKFKSLSTKFEAFYTAIEGYARFLHNTVETYKAADAAIAGKANELLND